MTYQTTLNRITFEEWEKFETYLVKQGMPDIIERHRARGLPETGFTELYSRYVKSLLAADGDFSGQDVVTGMRAEMVALANPYSLPPGEKLPVLLLFESEAIPDIQISIFIRSQNPSESEFFERRAVRTDDAGRAMIKVEPGFRYMLSAVHMVDVTDRDDAVWQSYWISLTFEIPQ